MRLASDTPKTTLKLYFELLDAVLTAGVADKGDPRSPCDGVKLSQILRGMSRAPKWVPTEKEVLALLDVVPHRYRAAIWLGAGRATGSVRSWVWKTRSAASTPPTTNYMSFSS